MGNEKKQKPKKPKKEKITYVDDGRTLADMSSVGGVRNKHTGAPQGDRKKDSEPRLLRGGRSSLKEQADTYFAAVRMMFLPMLVVIGILTLAFLIVWFLL